MSSPFPNPPVDVNSLLQPTSGDVVTQTIINALVTLGIRADLWPTSGALRSCMTVVGNTISAVINNTVIPATKAGWLPTSSGNWLAWLSLYMYGVEKTLATFATGSVRLTNGGGGTFSLGVGAVTFQNSTTKKTYTNQVPISLAPGPGTTQDVAIQAVEIGTASNASPGDITTIVTTMLGVTCTNLAPVLGIDDQTDASLQLECWNAIAANSAYGPAQAFGYAIQNAKNSVTGNPVNVNRWQTFPDTHTGGVQVWLAAPAGVPDPNDVTGVAASIEAIARPMCVQVTTTAVATVADTDALTVWVTGTPGLQASAVQAAVQAALSDFFATYPIGGKSDGTSQGLFPSAVQAVAAGAWPGVFEVTGANFLALVNGQVAVNSTTVTVRIV